MPVVKIGAALFVFLFFFSGQALLTAQVRIRIFTNQAPQSSVFSPLSGEYELQTYTGSNWIIKPGTIVLISKFNRRLAVKVMNDSAIICDSLLLKGRKAKDTYSLRLNGKTQLKRSYTGDLQCLPDFGTLLFISICDIESYIAGVVKSEGGSGKYPEYFKTQAVLARTYMYRYFDKHAADHFNLCDNTHCQAYNGLTTDSLIIKAAYSTRGEVILGPDSLPVIAAFHSNCGGETSPSEDVWLTSQPYLRKVRDPYCLTSRNAKWKRVISLAEWTSYLKKSGYHGLTGDPSVLSFSQLSRLTEYSADNFVMPLRQIRNDYNFRSTFFSVSVAGDSVIFQGRGYGHGVGLCQEGAMVMAAKGFTYRKIIEFYYTGIRIAGINTAATKPGVPFRQ
jgi:stage II sporulation protein D